MNIIIDRTWKQGSLVNIEDLRGLTFQAEAQAHTFRISGVDAAGNPITLTGTPSGVMLRPDNTDVALTCAVSDGKVTATLPAECYDVPGRVGITIYLTSNSQTVCIYSAITSVNRTSSGTASPGTTSSVVDLVNAINAAINSIPASYSNLLADIAPTYSDSALYAVGQYAWYDGDLKRCIVPITTSESYTAAHWTSAVLGQDICDLNCALGKVNDSVNEYGSVLEKQLQFGNVDETTTEDTTVHVQLTADLSSSKRYIIKIKINSAVWRSNGVQFVAINSYSVNSVSASYKVDAIRAATAPVTGNEITVFYTPTTDTVKMVAVTCYLGTGVQDIECYLEELYTELQNDIAGISDAIGNTALPTTAQTLTGAIAENAGQIVDTKSALDQFGIVKTSQVGTDSINETKTEDTNVNVQITGTYKKRNIYRITVEFNEVHWKSNGTQFLKINSYNADSIAAKYLVDSIQEATVSVTGNVSIDYRPTTDTVKMIGFVFFLGSGTQDIDVRVDEIASEASDKIQELEQLTDPYCDKKDYSFSGSVSNTTTAFHLRYNIFKGEKYRLTLKCITGTSTGTNCLRVATGDVANFGTSYNKDILNAASSINPLCGQINSFSTGEIISEEFTASENALYVNLIYYGVNPSNYDMAFKVSRVTTVKDIDNAVFGRGVVELNKDVEPFMLQFGREISSQTSEHSYKRLNFLFFSDIHANTELWNRICDYMDYYDDIIPFAVHAGDYVSNNLGSVVDLYGERKPKNGAILNTVGNHDCYPSGSSTPNAPIADVYNALYESVDPVTDGWNCTFNTTQYCMYWYKDIADTGVRIICIDQYHWDAAQSTFIGNALNDAVTNGYAVITITHTPITTSVDDIKSGFWTLDNWVVNDTYMDDMITIRALINAFITGGGVHIVNLCGHIHSDQIGLLHDDDIFQIRTQMAGNNELWTDTHRVAGTKTWDCFNVIQIDRNLNMVKLVRIGCNTSDCLQPRTTLCWDYANKKLISNN